jgi:hypothetical protein
MIGVPLGDIMAMLAPIEPTPYTRPKHMSAFAGKADTTYGGAHVCF